MTDIVVILDAEAIPAAREICSGLSNYETFLFDPKLGDAAVAAQLRNLKLFTQLGGPSFLVMDGEAHAAARALETGLDDAQCAYSGVSIVGWQHLKLSYLFVALRWYGALWNLVGAQFVHHKIHVLINDNPADYYFNSFVPSVTLVTYLREHGIPYVAYDYGAKGTPVYQVPDLPCNAVQDCGEHLLTHLPTCIYDFEYFQEEIRAAGKRTINLKARLWDLPIAADEQWGVIDVEAALGKLSPENQRRVAEFTVELERGVGSAFAANGLLPHYRARQSEHIVRTYRSQLVALYDLQRCFAVSPAKLLLSEHDTGFHGPLIAFAESRSLPVILLPHSKIMGDLEFDYGNILALTHPMQGTEIHDGRGRPVAHGSMSYPESFAANTFVGHGLRRVSLMLNSQTLSGIPFAPADAYLDGIKRLVTWCSANGLDLKVRCKPGYTLFGLLRAYVGLDPDVLARNVNEPMDEHVRDCDLCLMYDMPTSGSLYFLRRAMPILNPVVAELTKHQRSLVHPELIVPESVEVVLQRLGTFMADPLALHSFRMRQFHAYVSLFQRTKPLRAYL